MFESREHLGRQIEDLLETIRLHSRGRYACLSEPGRVLFERAEPSWDRSTALRALVEQQAAALFAIPASMASGDAMEDVFGAWADDEFLLAVINGRVALVVACPEAEPLRQALLPLLKVLADRLLRYEGRYRMDARGRGFFLGQPQLDLVVIGRAGG